MTFKLFKWPLNNHFNYELQIFSFIGDAEILYNTYYAALKNPFLGTEIFHDNHYYNY